MISQREFFLAVRCVRLMKEAGEEDSWRFKRLNTLASSLLEGRSLEDFYDGMAVEVAQLRVMPYEQYLRTEAWQQTRWFALERAGRRCEMCNTGKELEVHHRTYARLGEEWLDDLAVLCGSCHGLFHEFRELAEKA